MASGNRNKTNRNKRKTKKEQMEELEKSRAFRTEVTLWIIVAVALLLFISNFGFGGVVGQTLRGFLFGVFGLIAYVLPLILLIGSFFVVSNKGSFRASLKLTAAVLFVVFLCTFMALALDGSNVLSPQEAYDYCSKNHTGGGFLGGLIAYGLIRAFGLAGSFIIDIIVLIISLVMITERSFFKGMKKGGQKVYESAKENNERYREYRESKSQERKERRERRIDHKVSGVSSDTKIEKEKKHRTKSDEMQEIHADTVEPEITGNFVPDMASEELPQEPVKIEGITPEPPVFKEKKAKKEDTGPEPLKEDLKKEVEQVAQEISDTSPAGHYEFPPIDLLKPGKGRKSANTEVELRQTAGKLQQTLKMFGVNVKVTDISCGPAVTRYEIQPEMGVKVSKIVGLADDIKLNLAAADIRIEAPIPGKAAVGIEVPNKENVMVSFRELIESPEFQNSGSKISFAVGKDISGKTKVTDIAKMPHLLIAGATGSGKSVCINTIIMSILYKAKPDEVKLLMIDPKVVELSVYNGIPHLMIPVVTDPKKASGSLHWAVAEMTERYEKFAAANVRDINGYNAKAESLPVEEGKDKPQKMPQIVIIIDELADLMMVASNDVEEAICRLAQLARAAGIHLVIATQRPSVNVITGLIKANMPSRIAFAVTSGVDSRTILDMNGAEKLLGKGDMLFNPQGIPKPIRVQGAFISDKEVSDVVSYITGHNGTAEYNNEVQKKVDDLQSQGTTVSIADADTNDDGRDSYFAEAAKITVDKEKATIGMLQRYFRIGFNRAARIMDQLEEAGIVGPEQGTKPRTVLMSQEELEQFMQENE